MTLVIAVYVVVIFLAGVCVGMGIMSAIARANWHRGYRIACHRIAYAEHAAGKDAP